MKGYAVEETVVKSVTEKLDELRLLCEAHSLPVFATVAVGSDGVETKYKSVFLSPESTNRQLPDRRFADHIRIQKKIEDDPFGEVDGVAEWHPIQDF